MYNTTIHDKHDSIHDEYDTSEDENITETYEHYGENIHETEESKPTLPMRPTLNYTLDKN